MRHSCRSLVVRVGQELAGCSRCRERQRLARLFQRKASFCPIEVIPCQQNQTIPNYAVCNACLRKGKKWARLDLGYWERLGLKAPLPETDCPQVYDVGYAAMTKDTERREQ